MRTYRPLSRFKPFGWFVAVVESRRELVVHEPQRNGVINSSWALVVEPLGERGTRLLSRWRFRRRGVADALFRRLVFDPLHFIVEIGVLRGVKVRAERSAVAARSNQ